ncbi:DUF6884 domain-containing protein [Streptomyces scopuliridis]|uniref:DUF6884 domain-containing protein n=1 Tax=Streptomyces scopuliridis TaxID=452529 RepID=UPI00368233D6
MTPQVDLTWEQRAGLGSALLDPAGHLPAAVRGAALAELVRHRFAEPLPGADGRDIDLPSRVPQFTITDAGRERAAAGPRPRLLVVPCAMRKSGQAAASAEDMYVGSYHLAARQAAAALAGHDGRLLILSAKFGLLHPGDRILDYDLRAGQAGTVSAPILRRQARHMAVTGCQVTVLAGQRYAALARQVWSDIRHPLAGARGIGDHLSYFAQYRPGPRRGSRAVSVPGPYPQARRVNLTSYARQGDLVPKEQSVPFTPELVQHLAAGLLDTARHDIDSTLIDEAITDHLLNGEAPAADAGRAELSATDFRALQEAVGTAVRTAEVRITWPRTPAA